MMTNLLEPITHFKDQIAYLFQHPAYVKTELANNPPLLIEVIGILLLLFLLFLALMKPSSSEEKAPPSSASPQPANPPLSTQKTPLPEKAPQAWIKREPPSIHELSPEEEQALNQAMVIAGKQALAEVTGAPHQAEFFPHNDASEAAKKMFARQKNNTPEPTLSKQEFVLLYFMAPRSHVFDHEPLFATLNQMGLFMNSQHVFEYQENGQTQFYVSSALKPGTFDLQKINASTPGLSFILDLKTTKNGQIAFHKMLETLHTLSQTFKGDILDEHRQRLTQNHINASLAKIKALQNQQEAPA
jgi:FtsZ-interacting cell division protein ZipA